MFQVLSLKLSDFFLSNFVQVCLFDSDDEDSDRNDSESETGDMAASTNEGERWWKRNSISVASQGIYLPIYFDFHPFVLSYRGGKIIIQIFKNIFLLI